MLAKRSVLRGGGVKGDDPGSRRACWALVPARVRVSRPPHPRITTTIQTQSLGSRSGSALSIGAQSTAWRGASLAPSARQPTRTRLTCSPPRPPSVPLVLGVTAASGGEEVDGSAEKSDFGIPDSGKHEAAIIHEVITSSHQFIRLISKIQASAKTHIMIITPLYWQRACIIPGRGSQFTSFHSESTCS